MKEFATQTYAAVRMGKLAEPFDAAMVKRACRGWSERTYHIFFPKYAAGNPGRDSELLVRVARGSFRLKNSN